MPAVARTAPGRSSEVRLLGAAAGSHRGASSRAAALTASATANIHRHETQAVTTPESKIPAVAPSTDRPPQVASARACRSGSGMTIRSTAMAAGATRAAPAPSAKRAATRTVKSGASAAAAEAAPNAASPTASILRPPRRSASRPPSSSSPLNASPYAMLTTTRPDAPSLNSRPIAGRGTEIRVIVKIRVT
jgi:hypothetical protein